MNFFQNLINKIFGQEEEEHQPGMLEYGDQLKNTDLDYKFAQLFTLSGGIFNYCADESEALSTLKKIISAEQISSAFCCDEDLRNFLNVAKLPYSHSLEPFHDVAFITCEYLIAYDGRIMLSHNNILHYDPTFLPDKIIIMASVSQIVTTLSDAMMKIQNKRKKGIHIKNLTSISGGNANLDNPDKKNPKLFLLLLED